jgi:outer membrane murein-binding lipoprotein Lpp
MKRFVVLVAAVFALLLAGCATTPALPPLSIDDVVQLSKANTPPDEIVRKMKETRTVYLVSASEMIKLSKEGVSEKVLDYMQATSIEAARNDERYRNYGPWYPYPYGPYRWGRSPFWPYW